MNILRLCIDVLVKYLIYICMFSTFTPIIILLYIYYNLINYLKFIINNKELSLKSSLFYIKFVSSI